MKILCLVDGKVVPPDRWIWNFLPEVYQDDDVDFMNVPSVKDNFPKWGKLLAYYPSYFSLAWKAFQRSRSQPYDLIVAWEGKHGFPLALLRSVFGVSRPKLVILTYIQRGLIADLPWFTRFALRSVDRFTVTSTWEAEYYSRTLGIPADKFTFCPLGWYEVRTAEAENPPLESYIFASGRSYRDYKTFAAALKGIESKVIVNARPFNLRGVEFASNVTVNNLLPQQEFWALLRGASFVVVPLLDVPYSAGDGHIVQSMSAGKAVIATRGPSTQTYVEEGVTGLLVPPNDPQALHSAIQYLLEHPEEAKSMGQMARQRYEERYTFSAFALRTHEVLRAVVEHPDVMREQSG